VSDPGAAGDPGGQADPGTAVDAPAGTKPLGDPCDADGECASGLCWITAAAKGCTTPCTAMAQCQANGLLCLPIRPGVSACVPELTAAPDSCAGHQDCPFPLYCRDDLAWCELPECLHDGDCEATETCVTATRRCQVKACTADLQCQLPGQVCTAAGACGPPACTADGDCPAGDICHPVQGTCETPSACDAETPCYYNATCTDGRCLPNLCYAGCNGTDQCDPATGACGAACTANADCPSGRACGAASAICYVNTPPLAILAVAGGGPAATVAVAAPAALSGQASVDPEGEALSWAWSLTDVPPGSALTPGPLGTAATALLTPDAPGLYGVGLYVTDPGGLTSIQAKGVLVAK
jgi:hypothetical protein